MRTKTQEICFLRGIIKKMFPLIALIIAFCSNSWSQNVTWVLPLVKHQGFSSQIRFANFATDSLKNVFFNGNYSPASNKNFPVVGKAGNSGTVDWLQVDTSKTSPPLQVNLDMSDSFLFASSWGTTSVFYLNGQKKGDFPVGFEDLEVINGSLYGLTHSLVCRSDFSGNIKWMIPGPFGHPVQIEETDAGFLYAKCASGNNTGLCRILRIDTMGNVLWDKIYPLGAACKMTADDQGNCYVMQGNQMLKIDQGGNLLWTDDLLFEGTALHYSKSSGRLIVAENDATSSKTFLMIYDPNLAMISQTDLTPGLLKAPWTMQADHFDVSRITTRKNSIFIGGAYTIQTYGESFIARIDPVSTDLSSEDAEAGDLKVYPNPAKDNIRIRTREPIELTGIRLLSSNGQEVPRDKIFLIRDPSGYIFSCPDLSPGIYFLTLTYGNKVRSMKVVIR